MWSIDGDSFTFGLVRPLARGSGPDLRGSGLLPPQEDWGEEEEE